MRPADMMFQYNGFNAVPPWRLPGQGPAGTPPALGSLGLVPMNGATGGAGLQGATSLAQLLGSAVSAGRDSGLASSLLGNGGVLPTSATGTLPVGSAAQSLAPAVPGGTFATPSYKNPTDGEYQQQLTALSKKYQIPEDALDALFGTESDWQQFKNGAPNKNAKSTAIGMGQILKQTAHDYGADYAKLGTDWRYNMDTAARIYQQGYANRRNQAVPGAAQADNDRLRAMRAYDYYHDGHISKPDTQGGLNGKPWEGCYGDYYDDQQDD